MKQKGMSPHYQQLLECFSSLPQKILSLHGRDNMTEFVLHALCGEHCLNVSRAAYLVDNPDFDCLKGVAGFDKREEYVAERCHWSHPECFSDHMRASNYNKKVRTLYASSMKYVDKSSEHIKKKLSSELEMQDPIVYTWNIKHDNNGIILFEAVDTDVCQEHELLILQGLCLLGFCPVF